MPLNPIISLESIPIDLSEITAIISGSSLSEYISAEKISQTVGQLSYTVHMAIAVITLIVALLGCFFGYKFCRFFMSLTGLIIGLIAGYVIASKVVNLTGVPVILATLAGGIFLAAMSYWIYRAGIFILCFVFAFAAAANILPFTNDIQFFLCTLVGFIVGAVSQKFIRPVIILTSAIVCGMSAAGALINLAEVMNLGLPSGLAVTAILGAILSILGIVVQFLTTKEPGPRKKHS